MAKLMQIPQIAIGGGEPSLYPEFIRDFSAKCKNSGIIVNVTTNGSNINPSTMSCFQNVEMVSLSIDAEKVHGYEDLACLFEKMDLLKKHGIKVGANILLMKKNGFDLFSLVNLVRSYADFIYILQKKPSDVENLAELKKELLLLSSLVKSIYVDDSLQLAFKHKTACGRGTEFISIDPKGGVSACSFDKPFAFLENANELAEIVERTYPFKKTVTCPFI